MKRVGIIIVEVKWHVGIVWERTDYHSRCPLTKFEVDDSPLYFVTGTFNFLNHFLSGAFDQEGFSVVVFKAH